MSEPNAMDYIAQELYLLSDMNKTLKKLVDNMIQLKIIMKDGFNALKDIIEENL